MSKRASKPAVPALSKADRLHTQAQRLRNVPRYAATAERQERTSLEHALFYVAAELLDALALLSEEP